MTSSIGKISNNETLPYTDSWGTWSKVATLRAASYLTDPACWAHESMRTWSLIDVLNPESYRATNWARKFFLGMQMSVYSAVAVFTSLPAIGLRRLVCHFQQEPYIYYRGNASELSVEDSITQLMWNVCFPSAGHVMTDGGVLPWRYRINKTINEIKAVNADQVLLCEVFDIQAALKLYEGLKGNYAHFYFNMGPRATGVSSGLFFASKLKVGDPKFVPFPKEMLEGRTKQAEKGYFAFDVERVGRVFFTHLQQTDGHIAQPEPKYIEARRAELKFIMKRMPTKAIFTGDLNFDMRTELFEQEGEFVKDEKISDSPTWGGDAFCKSLVGEDDDASGPQTLDYAMFRKGTARSIKTELIETGYDGNKFRLNALSDHKGLYSCITLN